MPIKYEDFPRCVKEVLMSDDSLEANKEIIAEFEIAEEKVDTLFGILRKAVSQDISAEDLPETIARELGFNEEKSKKMAVKIAGSRLLVLSDFLKANIGAFIKKWGGDPEKFRDQNRKRQEFRKTLQRELGPIKPVVLMDEKLSPDEEKAEMLARVVELEFPDGNIRKRFRNIVVSYLKGVRTVDQIKDMLSRPQKIGGMGYDEDVVIKTAIAMEEMAKMEMESEKEVPAKEPEEEPSSVKKSEPEKMPVKEPESVKEEKFEKEEELQPEAGPAEKDKPAVAEPEEAEFSPLSAEEAPKLEAPEIPDLLPMPEKKEAENGKMEKESEPEGKGLIEESGKAAEEPSEKPVEDSFPPDYPGKEDNRIEEEKSENGRMELFGPIDEIREIKLIDFRRLSEDPAEAAKKIVGKINLLKEDSVLKKLEGIKAWQDSEVYGLYIDIGYEALLKDETVKDAIEERKNSGKPFLEEEEFYAVVGLNSSLKL